MYLDFIFFVTPDNRQLELLERALAALFSRQEQSARGRRLWLSNALQLGLAPSLQARYIDLELRGAQLNASESEALLLSVSALPKRVLRLSCPETQSDAKMLLFAIAEALLPALPAFLRLNEENAKYLLQLDAYHEAARKHFAKFPGTVYELAIEASDMNLSLEWLVDNKWLQAVCRQRRLKNADNQSSEIPDLRFASLDYCD